MRASDRVGTLAAFAIGDVLCPDAAEVLRHAGPELTVRGRILYFSDGGTCPDRFAIIEVDGIHTPLVVPVERLRLDDLKLDPGTAHWVAAEASQTPAERSAAN